MVRRHAASFVVVVALLLLALLSQAARPQPADRRTGQDEAVDAAGFDQAVDGECGGAGEEECLMRRTLTAQIDYIYTQGKQKP